MCIVRHHIKINRPICLISQSFFDDGLYHFNLFDDMTRSSRLDTRLHNIHAIHYRIVGIGISLGDFHRLQLLHLRLLGKFVFALIRIANQMTHIGDIPDKTNFVALQNQISAQHIEHNRTPNMTQMRRPINRRSTNIYSHMFR